MSTHVSNCFLNHIFLGTKPHQGKRHVRNVSENKWKVKPNGYLYDDCAICFGFIQFDNFPLHFFCLSFFVFEWTFFFSSGLKWIQFTRNLFFFLFVFAFCSWFCFVLYCFLFSFEWNEITLLFCWTFQIQEKILFLLQS